MLCACEMLFPNCGPLPQISQTCAMSSPGKSSLSRMSSKKRGFKTANHTGKPDRRVNTRAQSRSIPHHAERRPGAEPSVYRELSVTTIAPLKTPVSFVAHRSRDRHPGPWAVASKACGSTQGASRPLPEEKPVAAWRVLPRWIKWRSQINGSSEVQELDLRAGRLRVVNLWAMARRSWRISGVRWARRTRTPSYPR